MRLSGCPDLLTRLYQFIILLSINMMDFVSTFFRMVERMLGIQLLKVLFSLKVSQNKMVLWLTVALSILALLGSIVCFLMKSLLPVVPECIETGEAGTLRNRGKKESAVLQALLERAQPVTWVFAGDSITHGCMHTNYLCNYQEYFARAVKSSPERAYDTVVNTGVSGATTNELMEFFNAWVSDYQADAVFLCFGMNDCATDGMTPEIYARNLDEAVTLIRESGAVPILQTPNTSSRQKKLAPYLEAARTLAEQEDILCVDHNAFWLSHKKEVKKLMSDSIHPNEYGHLLWVRHLLQSLEIRFFAGGLYASGSYHEIPLPEDKSPVKASFSLDEGKSALFVPYFTAGRPAVWVYLGGGTTAGIRFSQNGARAYPEHIQEVARWEMIGDEYTNRMRYTVNQAHEGDTVSDMLLHYDEWTGSFHPAIVSIMPEFEVEGGQSPEAFEQDLRALVEKAKEGGALVILQTPLTLRKDLESYLSTMRHMEEQEGVILLDHALLAQETEAGNPQSLGKWFDSNGLPNAEGELVIARNFCVTLIEVPKDSRILTKHYSCV